MDAVHHQEWKMFAGLKSLPEEKAYQLFSLLHIPLYAAVLLLFLLGHNRFGLYLVDVFLFGHLLVHFGFRTHPSNQLTGTLSQALIISDTLLATVHPIMETV